MARKSVMVLVLVMLSMLATGGATAPTQASNCASPAEAALLQEINAFRQQNGLQPLTLSLPLDTAAQMKATDMASRNYIAHVSPDGQGPRELLNSAGYTYNTPYGENLAAGNESASATFQQWRSSAGHRDIMLDAEFKAIGIGSDYNPDSTYGWYWAAEFGGVVGEQGSACGEDPGSSSSVDAIIAIIVDIITRLLAG